MHRIYVFQQNNPENTGSKREIILLSVSVCIQVLGNPDWPRNGSRDTQQICLVFGLVVSKVWISLPEIWEQYSGTLTPSLSILAAGWCVVLYEPMKHTETPDSRHSSGASDVWWSFAAFCALPVSGGLQSCVDSRLWMHSGHGPFVAANVATNHS